MQDVNSTCIAYLPPKKHGEQNIDLTIDTTIQIIIAATALQKGDKKT